MEKVGKGFDMKRENLDFRIKYALFSLEGEISTGKRLLKNQNLKVIEYHDIIFKIRRARAFKKTLIELLKISESDAIDFCYRHNKEMNFNL